jgi:hypothetical protein
MLALSRSRLVRFSAFPLSSPLNSRHWSSSNDKPLLFRDMFVFDHTWTEEKFGASLNDAKSLYHPNSDHVLSKYALHEFNHGNFHFNQQGEFSLQTVAAHTFSGDMNFARTSGHTVLFWPDRLLIHGLQFEDVGAVSDLAMSSGPALSAEQIATSIYKKNPASTAEVSRLGSSCVVAVACSSGGPSSSSGSTPLRSRSGDSGRSLDSGAAYRKAYETIRFFRQAISELGEAKAALPIPSNPAAPLVVMTSELRGHRKGQQVVLLSTSDKADAPSEDCFAVFEGGQQARDVLRRFF